MPSDPSQASVDHSIHPVDYNGILNIRNIAKLDNFSSGFKMVQFSDAWYHRIEPDKIFPIR
jgi:hypothetical protein